MPDSEGIWARRPGFDSQHGKEISFFTASRLVLGPTQLPIKCVPGEFLSRIKRLGRNNHHSYPSSAEVKNGGDIPPLSHTSSWNGAKLLVQIHNFIFCTLTPEESHLSVALRSSR
jgi:hypothetical protein